MRIPADAESNPESAMLVSTLPISTTNMTGFFTMMRGSSFANAPMIAWRKIIGFQRLFFSAIAFSAALEKLSCVQQQVFENRPEAQCREEGKSANNENHARKEHRK